MSFEEILKFCALGASIGLVISLMAYWIVEVIFYLDNR